MVPIGIDEITEEESYTMAEEYRMALESLLRKAQMAEDTDFRRGENTGPSPRGSPAPGGGEAREDA